MMTRRLARLGLAFGLLLAVSARPARADLIVAGTTDVTGTAIMDLTLLPNTVFNPGSTAITLSDISGYGTITLHRDAEVAGTSPTLGNTIAIPTLSGGLFYGSNAALGSYVFGVIPPLGPTDFSGSITNVVQNPNDPGFATGQASSFQSGNFSFTGTSFGFEFLSGPAAGAVLFTDPAVPFGFAAAFDGLPPSQGTTLQSTGTDALNVLYNGQVVAQTSSRTIVLQSVPEPGSLALCGVGGVLAYCYRRRQKGHAA